MPQTWNNREIRLRLRFGRLIVLLVFGSLSCAHSPVADALPTDPTAGGLSSTTASAAPGPAASVTQSQPYTNEFQGEYFTSDLKEVFRITHIEGDGQGDVPAYTH